MIGKNVARSEKPDTASSDATEGVVSLVEEEARVEKRTVTTGRVRVRTVAEAVEEIATATLEEDEVDVVRISKDLVITEAPAIRSEAGVTIIPVVEERMVVTTQLVLKEELHIHRRTKRETIQVPITLRRQRAVVERLDGTDKLQTEE